MKESKMKHILSRLLVTAFIFFGAVAYSNIPVFAALPTSVTIQGVTLTKDKPSLVNGVATNAMLGSEGCTAVFNIYEGTLSLQNYTGTIADGTTTNWLTWNGGGSSLTLVLGGTNTINMTASSPSNICGIDATGGPFKIGGLGTLNMNISNTSTTARQLVSAITSSWKDMEIEGVTVNINVTNRSTHADSTTAGIRYANNLLLTNNTTVNMRIKSSAATENRYFGESTGPKTSGISLAEKFIMNSGKLVLNCQDAVNSTPMWLYKGGDLINGEIDLRWNGVGGNLAGGAYDIYTKDAAIPGILMYNSNFFIINGPGKRYQFIYTDLKYTKNTSHDVPAGNSGMDVSQSMTGGRTGGVSPFTYSKVSGPDWLTITAAGMLSGRRPDLTLAATAATIRVTDSKGVYKDITINVGKITAPYDISLSTTSKIYTPVKEGYAAPDKTEVTVNNTGDLGTGALSVKLSGANASSFEISPATLANIAKAGKATFTVNPKTGLAAGVYTATVTVSSDSNSINKSMTVKFTVNKMPYAIEVIGGTADKTTAVAGEVITVTAGTPGEGMTFKEWVSDAGVIFKEKNKPTTTFVMSGKKVTVKAVFSKIYVSSIKLNIKSANMAYTKGLQLKATPNSSATDKSVTFSVSNTKYATVDAKSGKVTFKKAGVGKTVQITATADDGSNVKATCTVKIYKPIKKVKIKGYAAIEAGKSKTFKAVVSPAKSTYGKVKWSTSNKEYATVSSKGKVTVKKAGKGKTVKIYAVAQDGTKKKATFVVKIK